MYAKSVSTLTKLIQAGKLTFEEASSIANDFKSQKVIKQAKRTATPDVPVPTPVPVQERKATLIDALYAFGLEKGEANFGIKEMKIWAAANGFNSTSVEMTVSKLCEKQKFRRVVRGFYTAVKQ